MFQHILVPLDGSSLAEEALPIAARLARATSASLILLHVITTYQNIVPAEPISLVEQSRKMVAAESQAYLARVITYEHLDGIHVSTEVLTGSPAQIIVQFAQTHSVGLIIMRSHGETGFKRWMLGSVAQQLIRHSPTPVLVLRNSGTPANATNLPHPLSYPGCPRRLITGRSCIITCRTALCCTGSTRDRCDPLDLHGTPSLSERRQAKSDC